MERERKFRAYWNEITEHEVVKETPKQIVYLEKFNSWVSGKGLRESREAKRSDHQNWFDTWDEAKAFLVDGAERKVVGCRKRLKQLTGTLGQLRGMKKPD